MNINNLASYFDHTLLKPEATEAQITQLCLEAKQNNFYAVCLNSAWLPLATTLLKNSSVLPITVVGFPLGASLSQSKAKESQLAIESGAQEIDMVLSVGLFKSGKIKETELDISLVAKACGPIPLKVILETSLLDEEEICLASKLCEAGGAQFVKTSTGFGSRGASEKDISLIKQSVGPKMKIKASGGIKTLELVEKMIAAGAHRVGSSSSVEILNTWQKKEEK